MPPSSDPAPSRPTEPFKASPGEAASEPSANRPLRSEEPSAPAAASPPAATSPPSPSPDTRLTAEPAPEAAEPTPEEVQRMLLQQADMALLGPPGAAALAPPLPVSTTPAPGPSSFAGAPHLAQPGEDASPAPVLEVSIGRLDVVAPPPSAPPRRRPRLQPRTTLVSYLDRRRQVIP